MTMHRRRRVAIGLHHVNYNGLYAPVCVLTDVGVSLPDEKARRTSRPQRV